MKIGFVLDDTLDRPDGVQQYVQTLGRWLRTNGHDVSYICAEGVENDQNIVAHELASSRKISFNGNRLRLARFAHINDVRKLLESQNYDVLHIQLPSSPMLGFRVLKVAKSLPDPPRVVATFHILPFNKLARSATWIYGKYHRRINAYIDEFLSVSPPAQAYAKRVFNIDSSVLPNVIDKRQKLLSKDASGIPYLVFLGRLVPRKGCMQFIEALQHVKTPVRVDIIGNGPQRRTLEKLVARLKLDKVHFRGSVSETEKYESLAGADIAILPSLGGESFGIVLLEAMAAGAGIVLAGNNVGYSSVMQLEEALIDPLDTKQFAITIDEYLNSPELCKQLHRKQQKLVEQFYTQTVGPKLLEVYRGAL